MWTRRQFLAGSAVGCGCLGLGHAVPQVWTQVARAAAATSSARRLVVIELQGGNDGLNTVIPFADDAYYRARPKIGIAAKDVIKLDDHLGMHPAMKSWRPLWDAGKLLVVENCGYPQPNRSHFESLDIWRAGQAGSAATSGWLGRASDAAPACELCYVGDGAASPALAARRRAAVSLAGLEDLQLRPDAAPAGSAAGQGDLSSAIAARLDQARSMSARLPKRAAAEPTAANSKQRPLEQRLDVIRALMEYDEPYRVYYTALDGFDTHASQRYTHESLWQQTSEAVSGFLDKLEKQKLADEVVVFLFSEFGRRVKENDSEGTDHGAAAPVFVLGSRVRGGVQGGVPKLDDLDDGDLRLRVDFRDVYAGLLGDWLGVNPAAVLGARPDALKMFG